MSINKQARSVADLSRGTIVATVEIAVPPERVFRALASEEITQWWGSSELYRTTKWTGDVRKGGRFESRGVGSDGHEFGVRGEYLEVDAPRKLVHTWEADWDPTATKVTYDLVPIEGGTRVTLHHEGFTSESSCQQHADGWIPVFRWLADFLVPPAATSHWFVRLLPPRPSFMMDMNETERAAMMAHAGYWRKLLGDGIAIAFGPVADPKGGYGIGLVEVESKEALAKIEAEDPAIVAKMGMKYEAQPMLQVIAR